MEEKLIKTKIVLDGVEEYRRGIQTIKSDMQELSNCIQSLNAGTEQLTQSLERFGKLCRQAETYSDTSSTSALQ